MKATALALLAASAAAQTSIVQTNFECFLGEGGEWKENCYSQAYNSCDLYEVDAGQSCKVYVFSDSQISWTYASIEVRYDAYNYVDGADRAAEMSGPMMNDPAVCSRVETATTYVKDKSNVVGKAQCGFVYYLDNSKYTDKANTFKVMKDSASTLIVGSAMALAAMLAF